MSDGDDKTTEKPGFEDALKQLESIVQRMEAGDLPLDDAMTHFEQGMSLAKLCATHLGETERKIEVLMNKMQDGERWGDLPKPERDDLQIEFGAGQQ